jgi:hypothetical protein
MNKEFSSSLKSFAVELVVYSIVVFAYFFLVLHFLGDWLYQLFHDHRHWYAIVALALIICQGVGLEYLTRALLDFIKPRTED